jgi:hypothetical protein
MNRNKLFDSFVERKRFVVGYDQNGNLIFK